MGKFQHHIGIAHRFANAAVLRAGAEKFGASGSGINRRFLDARARVAFSRLRRTNKCVGAHLYPLILLGPTGRSILIL